jgi:hypothetical protein
MSETSRKAGRWKRLGHSIIGASRSKALLANAVRKLTEDAPPFTFPLDPQTAKNVLIILPPQRLEVLHQLRNAREIATLFKSAKITLVAEESCADLAGLIGGAAVVTYPEDEKQLFSTTITRLTHELRGSADVCCLLARGEDLPLLYLTGMTGAALRVGYAGAGGQPFLNLHVKPSGGRVYQCDWNCAMAGMLGAKGNRKTSWTVAPQTFGEIDHLFRELHMKPAARLAGIDALFFYRTFGPEWTEGCIKAILPVVNNALYLFAEETHDEREIAWLSQEGQPLIQNLSVPQIAALAGRSALVVSGNTLLFGLATLLERPAVGVFDAASLAAFCPASPLVRGIACEQGADATTIGAIVSAAAELLKTPSNTPVSPR